MAARWRTRAPRRELRRNEGCAWRAPLSAGMQGTFDVGQNPGLDERPSNARMRWCAQPSAGMQGTVSSIGVSEAMHDTRWFHSQAAVPRSALRPGIFRLARSSITQGKVQVDDMTGVDQPGGGQHVCRLYEIEAAVFGLPPNTSQLCRSSVPGISGS